jgi:hypothetical protein
VPKELLVNNALVLGRGSQPVRHAMKACGVIRLAADTELFLACRPLDLHLGSSWP